jgi:hypothetical protein
MRRFFLLAVGLYFLAATNAPAAAGGWYPAEPCCGGGHVARPYVGPVHVCDVCTGAALVNQGQYYSPEPIIPVGVYPYWYRADCFDHCGPYIPGPLPYGRHHYRQY